MIFVRSKEQEIKVGLYEEMLRLSNQLKNLLALYNPVINRYSFHLL